MTTYQDAGRVTVSVLQWLKKLRVSPFGCFNSCRCGQTIRFLFALLLLASSAAQAHVIFAKGANTCFAERIGDNLESAWNVPINGEETDAVIADPEGEGPISIYFNEAMTETTTAIGDDYFDWLDVYVSGLSLGQSVVLERFLVDNNLGIINADAVLMESHRMQDGFLPLTGGIPNLSSVEDWDGERNGQIWTQLGMFGGVANMPGEYVIRVSSPLGSFPPATAQSVIIAPKVFGHEATLEGYMTYESADSELDGTPVGGLRLWAQNIIDGELVNVFQRTYKFNGYYNIFLSEGNWFVIPDPYESARRQLLLKNLPWLEVMPDAVIEEIPWNITAVDAERVIEVTIEDAEGNPVPGIPIHAEMDDGMDTYDAFGVTNASGVATIPARGGHWELHVSHSTMRRVGLSQFPHQHVMVPDGAGDPVALPLVATPFTGALPEVTSTRTENGRLVIEGTGEPGKLFDVEGSSDLKDWFYAGRVIALGGGFSIKDPLDAGHEEAATGESSGRLFYHLKNRE